MLYFALAAPLGLPASAGTQTPGATAIASAR